jgi:hypothetical protein
LKKARQTAILSVVKADSLGIDRKPSSAIPVDDAAIGPDTSWAGRHTARAIESTVKFEGRMSE